MSPREAALPFCTPHRGVRRVVTVHICVSGDPLDCPTYGAGLLEGAEPLDEGRVSPLCVPAFPEAAFGVLAVGEDGAMRRGVVASEGLGRKVLEDHPDGPELPKLVGAAP